MALQILVTNINPKAQEKDIASFFAFCGKISSVSISTGWEGPADQTPADAPLKAVIHFEASSSVETAMLLNNALLLDKPISVRKIADSDSVPAASAGQPGAPAPARPVERKPSLLAALVASTYVAGVEAVDFVRAVDDKAKISESIVSTTETIDEKLEISQTAKKVGAATEEKLNKAGAKLNEFGKDVDGKLKIGENLNKVHTEVASAAQKTQEAIMQTAPMQSMLSFFKPMGQAITNSIEELKKDTKDAIAQKKAEYEKKKAADPSLSPRPADSTAQAASAPAAAAPAPPSDQASFGTL